MQETYVESRDAGVTFGPELPLGPSIDIRFAAMTFGFGPREDSFLGDYLGVVLSADEAHAVWPLASYNGTTSTEPHQTTWAATVREEMDDAGVVRRSDPAHGSTGWQLLRP